MKNRIVLLGPPASGKGTQAALLAATFGLPAASTGAMLREEKSRGSAIGTEAERWTTQGGLVPDELALRIVWQWIDGRTRFIFDGFPRTLGQAQAFDDGLQERGLTLDVVYLLELSDETVLNRICTRLTCPGCGSVFNESFHFVTKGSPCPSCGVELTRRKDDTREALDRRLSEYRKETLPVTEHYEARGLLRRIDASPARAVLFQALYDDLCANNPEEALS
jgi:adenylate kinase